MYQNRLIKQTLATLFFAFAGLSSLKAQLSVTGQLRTRTEFRDGAGTLLPAGYHPSFFTSQRSRLTLQYAGDKIIFHTSIQDVRVWGQDASTINGTDGSRLSVHEAWAELVLANKKDSAFHKAGVEYFGIRVGRQELLYDDSRLLGNLDWLQQARHHDAVVFKLLENGWRVDLGAAFNQNTDAFNYNGTYYTPANVPAYVKDSKGNLVPVPSGLVPLTNASGVSAKNGNPSFTTPPSTNGLNQNYKALQFLYAAKTFGSLHLSGLFVADQFGKYMLDSVQTHAGSDTGYLFGRRYNQSGVNARFTTGLLAVATLDPHKHWALTAGAYYQGGKDRDGLSMAAYTTTVALTYAPKKLAVTAGWDLVSGNDAFSSSTTNHRFDPLYGTPHKFWGLMDYFYAGTGAPAGGLSNPYLKLKYAAGKSFSAGLDYHYFALAGKQADLSGGAIDKYLGSEIDLTATCKLNRFAALQGGFSLMAASKSMEYAKNRTPGSSHLTGTWAFLQLNITPELFHH